MRAWSNKKTKISVFGIISGRRMVLGVVLFLFLSSSVAQKKDSLRFYKKLKKLAYRHKYSTVAYDAVFVDPEPKEYPKQPASREEKIVNPYLKYSNRIIRYVNIEVYDPFGYSVTDTVLKKINQSQKIGNNLHIKTRKFIINNRLLFKDNEPLNALKLSESERILREAVFVNDARIFVTETPGKDSVDVNVIVHDKWPITIPLAASDIDASAKFRNQNLFGWGQQFQQFVGYKRSGQYEYSGYYNISNIDNTFISSNVSYQTTIDGTRTSLVFDRPFYSPLARWAGGAQVTQSWLKYAYFDTNEGVDKSTSLNSIYYDAWGGKNIKLSKDTSLFNQSTNFVVGGRYYQNIYQQRPALDVDGGIRNYSAFVGNIGFSIQQFYKDRYIYRFGANEDVPQGLIVQLIYGGLKRELLKLRYYLGAEIARAKHFDFGYLSTTFAYGVFFNKEVPNDITVSYKINYFSNLLRKGSWYFREFVSYSVLHGENKLAGEKVTLSSDDLYGFSPGPDLLGNTKMVLNSETVAYMPYNIIGFRMAPVLMVGVGVLGDPQNRIQKSRLFQGYSLGILFRNENLLSSTFQVSFGLYPFLPDGQTYILKYNPITSFTLRVRAFSVSRPEFIPY